MKDEYPTSAEPVGINATDPAVVGPEALGSTWPTRRSMLENPNPAPGSPLESNLPQSVPASEIASDANARARRGNLD